MVRTNLAYLREHQGRYAEALSTFRRAHDDLEHAAGMQHPQFFLIWNNMGRLYEQLGEYEQAKVLHEKAVDLGNLAMNPDHPHMAYAFVNLARACRMSGDARALHFAEQSVAINEKHFGAQPNTELAESLLERALVLSSLGRHKEALADARRALEIREKLFASTHPDIGDARMKLAEVLLARGASREALVEEERALSNLESALGPDHPQIAAVLFDMGQTLLALGEPARAIAPLERALRLRERQPMHPQLLADVRAALERASLQGSQ
jgi:serine/threonine-protein kinase